VDNQIVTKCTHTRDKQNEKNHTRKKPQYWQTIHTFLKDQGKRTSTTTAGGLCCTGRFMPCDTSPLTVLEADTADDGRRVAVAAVWVVAIAVEGRGRKTVS
jgi:hypothetical protein